MSTYLAGRNSTEMQAIHGERWGFCRWFGALLIAFVLVHVAATSALAAETQASRLTDELTRATTSGYEFEFSSPLLWHLPFEGNSIFERFGSLWKAYEDSYIDPDGHEHKAAIAMRDYVMKKCADCKVEEVAGKTSAQGIPDYKITFPDGYWFKITADCWVVEVIGLKLTTEEVKTKHAAKLGLIFAAAKSAGLSAEAIEVPRMPWAGHLNIGVRSAFGFDVEHFARFISDYASNPALSSGVFGKDYFNAPPMSTLSAGQRFEFGKLIDDVNLKKFFDIPQFGAQVLEKVYTKTPLMSNGDAQHYQAMGMKHVAKIPSPFSGARRVLEIPGISVSSSVSEDRILVNRLESEVSKTNADMILASDLPVEIRAMRAQRNADDFRMVTEIIQARIRFLKSLSGTPVVYNKSTRQDYSDETIKGRFVIYVSESGLKPSEYMKLLPESVRDSSLDLFVGSKKAKWDNPDYADAIREHLELVSVSPFVFNKLVSALKDPSVNASKESVASAKKILSEVANLVRDPKSSSASKARMSSFFAEVYADSNGIAKSASLKSLFRAQDDFVREIETKTEALVAKKNPMAEINPASRDLVRHGDVISCEAIMGGR